jgi:hypothetical protein
VECQSWFPSQEGTLCIIHRGVNTAALAANGVNKEKFIEETNDEQKNLRDLVAGKTPVEACSLLDAHIAKLEKIIEEQKNKYFSARAIRAEVIEGLSEEERQVRRRTKVTVSSSNEVKEKKSSKKMVSMSKDEMVQAMLKKYPALGLDGVKKLLGVE